MLDKALYQAPQGLASLPNGTYSAAEFEFDVETDPEVIGEVDETSVTVLLDSGAAFGRNLAEDMDSRDLTTLASGLVALFDADLASRKDWEETFVDGLKVLGLRYEERTEPWVGACGVFSTVLAEAAIRFQSETIMETFPAAGPVKTEIIGAIDKLKEEAASRVKDDMNYQITEKMPEYRPEHERMLYSLGLAGAAFKKVYMDTGLNRQTSIFVPAEDVVIPWGSTGSQTAERVTHVMRKTKNEVRKLQVSGFYIDEDLGEPVQTSTNIEKKKAEMQGYSITDDDRYQFLEMQVDYDMPGFESEDGVAYPYIVTIDRGTSKVLSIYRNWEEQDKTRLKRQHFVQYTYIPGFGAYGMGLIHLIGGYARAGTSIIRELVDAGQLSNLPGGFKTRGMRIKGDDTPIAPGEFRDVDIPSGTMRDNIIPLPYKEPSQVLMALLGLLTDEARRLGAISDMNISDMSANMPVGTTLALLERTLKTMGAVQARVHYSMKQEFKLLAVIIRDHTPDEYNYTPDFTTDRKAKKADYDTVEVIPVSDPNSSTMAQRIMQYQAAHQLSLTAPQIYDLPFLHRQMLEVLGIKNAAKMVPVTDDMTPRDPISENMAFLNGKPTKAFIYQDHEAHIAVHQSFMQDPLIAQTLGQNPMAQQMQAAIMAHISEHLAYSYRAKIQERLGVTMPSPDMELPQEIESAFSKLVAQAAQQLLAINQNQAAQAQVQQQMQDPMLQLKQAEVQIKGQEAATKAKKVDGDLAIAQAELALEAQKGGMDPAALEQEAAQAREVHQQELQAAAQQQQAQQQQAQAQQQQAQQQQALAAQQAQQAAQHKDMAHQQTLTHKQQAHEHALAMKAQAAEQAAKLQAAKPKAEPKPRAKRKPKE